MAKVDSLFADTIVGASDTMAIVDTVAVEKKGIVMIRAQRPEEASMRVDSPAVNSWLLGGMSLIFCLVCIRYKNNYKYFKALFTDLIDPRERAGFFDDTIRENSFLILTNILNAASLGLIIYEIMSLINPNLSSTHSVYVALLAIAVYYCAMPFIYFISGNIFSDETKAKIWTKGFFITGAITSLPMFFASMTALFYPTAAMAILFCAALIYVIIRLLFIRKGFVLFYSSGASWILMGYYIVGMEIVPLLLVAASLSIF